MELKEKKCQPCEGGVKPMNKDITEEYLTKVSNGWEAINGKKIRREYPFENFRRGMAFANQIAVIAEQEDHHPDLCIHYHQVDVELTTHAIGGLSENDFIMAAKIDEL